MRGRRQNEERPSKRGKREKEEREDARGPEEEQQAPLLPEEPGVSQESIVNEGSFSLLNAMFSSLVQLLTFPYTRDAGRGGATRRNDAPRRRRGRNENERAEDSSRGYPPIDRAPITIGPLYTGPLSGSEDVLESDLERDNAEETGGREELQRRNQEIESLRRRILSVFQTIFSGRERSEQERAPENAGRAETEDGGEAGQRAAETDFEIYFSEFPGVGQDPNNIVFTVIYYIGEETPRRKTVNIRDLDKNVPEENAEGCKGQCSICLEDIGEGEKIRTFSCRHFFHSKCVSEWLTKYVDECPMCRKPVLQTAEAKEDGAAD